MKARKRHLGCQSQPRGDCKIKAPQREDYKSKILPIRNHGALTEVRELTHDIREFRFKLDKANGFLPGQYGLIGVEGVNGMRASLCAVLGATDDKLHVESYDVGGAFGVRSQIYPEYTVLILASKKLGRPVKWSNSRSEGFLTDEQGRDVVSTGELALDDNGRFLAMRFSFITNLGAYTTTSGAFINFRATAPMTGLYDVPLAYGRNQMFLTNTAPMAAYRGAGRPIMSAMLERLVGQAALHGTEGVERQEFHVDGRVAFEDLERGVHAQGRLPGADVEDAVIAGFEPERRVIGGGGEDGRENGNDRCNR